MTFHLRYDVSFQKLFPYCNVLLTIMTFPLPFFFQCTMLPTGKLPISYTKFGNSILVTITVINLRRYLPNIVAQFAISMNINVLQDRSNIVKHIKSYTERTKWKRNLIKYFTGINILFFKFYI